MAIETEAVLKTVAEQLHLSVDGSFVDIWFSLKLPGRYSYHWELEFRQRV